MRVLYVLLVAAVTLVASSEATAISDHMKTTSAEAVTPIEASKADRRFLRSQKATDKTDRDGEERTLPNALVLADDAANVFATADDISMLTSALAATKTQTKMMNIKPLFERMFKYPNVKEAILKEIAKNQQLPVGGFALAPVSVEHRRCPRKQQRRIFREERHAEIRLLQEKERAQPQGCRGSKTGPANKDDFAYGLLTQNVNGFGQRDADRDAWIGTSRGAHDHGRNDIVLVQETHVERTEVNHVERLHAAEWGCMAGLGRQALSLVAVSRAERRRGILVDPYGVFKNATPTFSHHWNEHYMAVRGLIQEKPVVVLNTYAPHRRAPREALFRKLAILRYLRTQQSY
ncbi:hypothetical protein PI126_g18433 [Phytophthora idaei]|nr:hypothetical protein PI126_g18433 [Phytophthora idaei]